MRFLELILQLIYDLSIRVRVNRFIRQVTIEHEVQQGMSSTDVELYFIPGLNAPDSPIVMSGGAAFAVFIGLITALAIFVYLMVHLSPPLW